MQRFDLLFEVVDAAALGPGEGAAGLLARGEVGGGVGGFWGFDIF